MTITKFGKDITNTALQPRDYIAEMQEVIGSSCPCTITTDAYGELVGVSYETRWKEGGTKPVKNKKGEVTDYKAEYKDCSLTKDQIKKLDNYIATNIKVD